MPHQARRQTPSSFLAARFPHIPNGRLGIGAVKADCRDLLLDDPVFDLGTVNPGIAGALMEEQIDFIRKDGGAKISSIYDSHEPSNVDVQI